MNYTSRPSGIYPSTARVAQYKKINVLYHINSTRGKKNHTILSTDVEKAFDKIKHPFIIKTLRKLGIIGDFLDKIKEIYKKTHI